MTKVESVEEVQLADEFIGDLERERGIGKGTIKIKPLIESAIGVWNAFSIATASERICQFGDVAAGDTTADLGIEMAGEVDQLFYCRQRGLSEEDAISMIVNGFCKEVFRELPMEFAVEAQKLLGISLEGAVG